MHRIISYQELTEALGVKRGYVSTYVTRGKLYADKEKKLIDLDHPINIEFIKNRVRNGGKCDLDLSYIDDLNGKKEAEAKRKAEKEAETNTPLELPEYHDTEDAGDSEEDYVQGDLFQKYDNKRKLKTEILYKEAQTRKTEIEIKKREGELIPFDEATYLLGFTVEEIRVSFIQESESLADLYKDRFGISHEEYVEIKKDLRDMINTNIKESVERMMKGVDNVREQYREVRSRGEKK